MQNIHGHGSDPYKYWQIDSVPIMIDGDEKAHVQRIKLIDAFNKKFIFFYNSSPNTSNVKFIIFLLGFKRTAQKFIIDFELRKDLCKVKYVVDCINDVDALSQLENTNSNGLITIPKSVAEKLMNDNKEIMFRFIIKRRDRLAASELAKEEHLTTMLNTSDDKDNAMSVQAKKMEVQLLLPPPPPQPQPQPSMSTPLQSRVQQKSITGKSKSHPSISVTNDRRSNSTLHPLKWKQFNMPHASTINNIQHETPPIPLNTNEFVSGSDAPSVTMAKSFFMKPNVRYVQF